MISLRAKKLVSSPSPILVARVRCDTDPYSQSNPGGYINLGTAENYLLWDLIEPKLRECRAIVESDIHYNPTFGLTDFRKAVAEFLNRRFKTQFSAKNLIIANGATAILDMAAFALCEPGDGIIVPSPYYPGFNLDLSGRAAATILTAPTRSEAGFKMTLEALEKALSDGNQKRIPVKALLITNPTNPLGTLLDTQEIQTALQFCEDHNLHCLFDEIYGNSVHPEKIFQSAFASPFKLSNKTHFIYGLSKDFTLAGFRIGIFHSENEDVLSAMRALSTFNNASTGTQRAMTHLLRDPVWVDHFLQTNQTRLEQAYSMIKTALEERTNLKFWPACAGIFAWVDFRSKLTSNTFEAETDLYEKILNEAKVNLLPGNVFRAVEPGWFRLCYAQNSATLETAADRLASIF